MSPCHYAGNRTRGVASYFFELDSVTSGWVWAERMEKAPEKSSFCPILVLSFHLFHMQPLSDKRFALFFYGSAWPVQNKKTDKYLTYTSALYVKADLFPDWIEEKSSRRCGCLLILTCISLQHTQHRSSSKHKKGIRSRKGVERCLKQKKTRRGSLRHVT